MWPRVGLLGAGSGKHSTLALGRPCWASVGQVWIGADFREFRAGLGKVESQAGENAGVAVAPLHGSPRPATPVA